MNELLRLVTAVARLGAGTCRRWPQALLCLLIAVPCAIGAIGCAIAALWIYLAPRTGPAGAPLIVAAGLLILAVVLVFVGKRMLQPDRAVVAERQGADVLIGEIGRFLQEHKGMTLLVTLLAGLVAGAERRKK